MKKILTVTFALLFSAVITVNTVKAEKQFDDTFLSTKCHTFSTSPEVLQMKQKLSDSFLEGKTMQTFAISPKNRFKVHYDTVGRDAVDLTDLDKNGIPDYIDSVCAAFDFVYEFHIHRLGMHKPKSNPNDELFDVFVKELGNQLYPTYGWAVDNYPYSYIVIDNNYSPNDTAGGGRKAFFTTGIDGMKVTTAHEYHHAVQFLYGNTTHSVMEMSATFMEMLIYPEIEDYLQYVNMLMSDLTRFNFGDASALNGYSFCIFFYKLAQKYGEESIKKYWETVEEDFSVSVPGYAYAALEKFFNENNSTLAEEWEEFLECIYFSGANTVEGKCVYLEPIAKRFRNIAPVNTLRTASLNVDVLTPYELIFTRFINTSNSAFIAADTVDIIFTNVNTFGVIYQYHSPILCSAQTSNSEIFDGKKVTENYWLKINSPSENMRYLLNYRLGGAVSSVSSAYPQPFVQQQNDYLFFPIGDDFLIGEKVYLEIFDMNLRLLVSEQITATVDNEKRVVKYFPANLDKGVYAFTVGKNDNNFVGKFVIK